MVKEKNKNGKEKVSVNSEKFQNKQLRNIILVMGLLILVAIIAYTITNSLANPTYKGLKFSKVKEGNTDFYVVKVPAVDPLNGQTTGYYDMILRTNPKDLEKIDYSGRTKFLRNVVMSFDTGIEGCEDNVIAVANMARFLTDAGFNVKGASHNYEYAQETNMSYVTCEDATDKTVLVLQKALEGEVTTVKEALPNCYIINIAQCQTLPALERIMVETAVSTIKQQ